MNCHSFTTQLQLNGISPMAEHHPVLSETLQPHIERSSRPNPDSSSMKADVYIWRYALLLVHGREDEEW